MPPSHRKHGRNGSASSAQNGPLRPRRGPRGIQLRGGNKSGKVCPDVPSTPKAESSGRLRLAALESGFLSFKTEIASMFVSLNLTASHPLDSNATGSRLQGGGAHGGGIFPSRELEDPLASQRPFTGPLGPTALPLVGRAGVLTAAGFFPHGNWRTPLLANGPSRGRWARRLCHLLVRLE